MIAPKVPFVAPAAAPAIANIHVIAAHHRRSAACEFRFRLSRAGRESRKHLPQIFTTDAKEVSVTREKQIFERGGSVKLLEIKIIPPIACLNNQASLHRLRVTSERALRMTAITGRAPTPTIGGSKWLRLSTVYNRKP